MKAHCFAAFIAADVFRAMSCSHPFDLAPEAGVAEAEVEAVEEAGETVASPFKNPFLLSADSYKYLLASQR